VSNPVLAATFFLQLALLLLICRALGTIARPMRQPQAVAEMVAGLVLGPSLFGWIAPSAQAALFPQETLRPLYVLSQLGLALYMFTVGLEFDRTLLQRHAARALSVSLAGIVAPFTLGIAVAVLLVQSGGFFAPAVQTWQAILFVGAAMSITAFPMLARIIQERGIAGTDIGTLALAAGAMDDAAAWVAMALVLGTIGGGAAEALWPAFGGAAYAFFVLRLAQPLLRRLRDTAEVRGQVDVGLLTVVLALLALGAWATERAGIHAVLGAFLLGVAIPRGVLTRSLHNAIAPLTTAVLVPLFFVYSGLNTQLGLVTTPWLVLVLVLVFVVSSVGKGVACWAAARLSGARSTDAAGVGALMNARGMMELILLNIALERGVITPALFTIFAMMAIGTTLMASPLFGWLCPMDGRERAKEGRPAAGPVRVKS
jgi:Kef-type K+ transport system membrane component KefB